MLARASCSCTIKQNQLLSEICNFEAEKIYHSKNSYSREIKLSMWKVKNKKRNNFCDSSTYKLEQYETQNDDGCFCFGNSNIYKL